ncbi:MAG: 50S ribosomal protein L9 [Coriobacteriales bacterium]|nr:50S ribosomal protein L9 [Actinomycetes bacterium]
MKVILLSDVKGRGNEGDVIEVARGYAVNYLLPRKIAIEATPGNIKQLEARMHNIRKREAERHSQAETLAEALGGKVVVIEAKAGEEGKLFGSVTPGMVADALSAQLGVDVDRRRLDAHGHIKVVGDHPVEVHLYQDVVAEVTVRVVPEGSAPAVAPVTKDNEETSAEAPFEETAAAAEEQPEQTEAPEAPAETD